MKLLLILLISSFLNSENSIHDPNNNFYLKSTCQDTIFNQHNLRIYSRQDNNYKDVNFFLDLIKNHQYPWNKQDNLSIEVEVHEGVNPLKLIEIKREIDNLYLRSKFLTVGKNNIKRNHIFNSWHHTTPESYDLRIIVSDINKGTSQIVEKQIGFIEKRFNQQNIFINNKKEVLKPIYITPNSIPTHRIETELINFKKKFINTILYENIPSHNFIKLANKIGIYIIPIIADHTYCEEELKKSIRNLSFEPSVIGIVVNKEQNKIFNSFSHSIITFDSENYKDLFNIVDYNQFEDKAYREWVAEIFQPFKIHCNCTPKLTEFTISNNDNYPHKNLGIKIKLKSGNQHTIKLKDKIFHYSLNEKSIICSEISEYEITVLKKFSVFSQNEVLFLNSIPSGL